MQEGGAGGPPAPISRVPLADPPKLIQGYADEAYRSDLYPDCAPNMF